MVSLLVVFYLFLVLFSIIGGMRGWGKELLIVFSVILALAFITVIETLVPPLAAIINSNPSLQFWVRVSIVLGIVFFGYQSPRFARLSKATEKRDRIQDVLLGLIMGLISGYMVVGTIWHFVHVANYPFGPFLIAPSSETPLGEAALRVIKALPPVWLGKPPNVYIAVVLAFIFVIVIFV